MRTSGPINLGFTDLVARRWPEPDAGIWEISDRRRRRRETTRSALAADIRARGFDTSRNTYTRSYGSGGLDSALVILPVTGFEALVQAALALRDAAREEPQGEFGKP